MLELFFLYMSTIWVDMKVCLSILTGTVLKIRCRLEREFLMFSEHVYRAFQNHLLKSSFMRPHNIIVS